MKTVQKCSDQLNLPYIFRRSLIVSHLHKTFYSTVSPIFMFIVTFNLKLAYTTKFIRSQYYISEIPLTIADNWMGINIITMISVSWWYLDFCRACCSSNDNSSCLEGSLPEFVTFVSFLTLAHTGGFWKYIQFFNRLRKKNYSFFALSYQDCWKSFQTGGKRTLLIKSQLVW